MYNEKMKRVYLDQMNEEEDRSEVERLFEKTEVMEEEYAKDLAKCNLEELIAVLHHLAPGSLERSVRNKQQIEAYIDWNIDQGSTTETVNPFKSYGEDWCNQFVTSS